MVNISPKLPIYYLYRHIRLDKNIPFYIGMGTVRFGLEQRNYTQKYNRAFSKKGRSRIWNGIVGKTSYEVEILCESNEKTIIFEKEKEFISLYGRIDNRTGTLANLTDGGDGSTNLSEFVIKETVAKNRINGCFKRNGKKLRDWVLSNPHPNKGKERDEGFHGFLETFAYSNIDGSFISKFQSRRDAKKALGINKNAVISNYIKAGKRLGNYMFFNTYQGEVVDTIPSKVFNIVHVYDSITGEHIETLPSLQDAARLNQIPANRLCEYISFKRIFNQKIFSYSESIAVKDYTSIRATNRAGVRKTICAKCCQPKESMKWSYCKKCSNIVYKERFQKIKNGLK